jgi:hypothetical protein
MNKKLVVVSAMAIFLLMSSAVAGSSNWMLLAKSKSDSGSSGSSSGSEDTAAPTAKPDKDCAFNPNGLAKCKPDLTTGKCPSGFSANDKGNCFPKGPCPTGYARLDNDESGKCFRISS